jgi:hypothetical protein
MLYHILNGDSLATIFPEAQLSGEIIVMREALIEGDLQGDDLDAFWQTRAHYLLPDSQDDYYLRSVSEFNKLMAAPDHSTFHLWFGYDLFCQVNMWFVMSVLNNLPISKRVLVVYPSFQSGDDIWKEYGPATADDLVDAFMYRTQLHDDDLQLGADLWNAYKNNDLEKLSELSKNESICFPYLQEVCKAHIDRFPAEGKKGRPERTLEDIVQHVSTDFNTVFGEFFNREGVYGFGDVQLKKIYDRVISEHVAK